MFSKVVREMTSSTAWKETTSFVVATAKIKPSVALVMISSTRAARPVCSLQETVTWLQADQETTK